MSDKITEQLKELLSSLICARMVQHTDRICEAVGIDSDAIRYKRNSRYLVADRMNGPGFDKEVEKIWGKSGTQSTPPHLR